MTDLIKREDVIDMIETCCDGLCGVFCDYDGAMKFQKLIENIPSAEQDRMTDVLEVTKIEKIQELQNESFAKGFADGKEEGLRVARQDRPIGHWEIYQGSNRNVIACSCCKQPIYDPQMNYYYCPFCGAKMDSN